jgi:hypothetical protein
MQNSGPLAPFGILVIVLTGILIVVPYLRRKSDALTAWNILLFSGAIFIGIGCLEVTYGFFHWPELQWFQPTRGDIRRYMLGATIFYTSLLITYYKFPLARSIGARFWNKWPPMSISVLLFVLTVCLAFSLAAFVVGHSVILVSLVKNVSHKAAVFAVVFSFCFWFRDKRNPLLLGLFVGVLCYACLFSMLMFGGRRLILSVAVSPLICTYWLRWRYLSPRSNLIRLSAVAIFALCVAMFFSSIRHYHSQDADNASVAKLVESLHATSLDKMIHGVTRNWLHYFSQYSVHYSLLTMQLVDKQVVPVEPLNTLLYVLVYPVPRAIWANKPALLGGPRLVNGILQMPYHTSWGLGIVANGYQEGGMVVIALYAFLAAFGLRIFDDAMVRHPDNPFLLAIFCSISAHLVAWVRGEAGIMTTEILEAFFFAWGLSLLCRFIFGTTRPTSRPVAETGFHSHVAAPLGRGRQ